jgi:hypothetical protein
MKTNLNTNVNRLFAMAKRLHPSGSKIQLFKTPNGVRLTSGSYFQELTPKGNRLRLVQGVRKGTLSFISDIQDYVPEGTAMKRSFSTPYREITKLGTALIRGKKSTERMWAITLSIRNDTIFETFKLHQIAREYRKAYKSNAVNRT